VAPRKAETKPAPASASAIKKVAYPKQPKTTASPSMIAKAVAAKSGVKTRPSSAPAPKAPQPEPERDDEEAVDNEPESRQRIIWAMTSFGISTLVHMLVLLLLGLFTVSQSQTAPPRDLVASVSDQPGELEEVQLQDKIEISQVESSVASLTQLKPMVVEVPIDTKPTVTQMDIKVTDLSATSFASVDLLARVGTGESGTISSGRGESGKKAALAARGGNDITEAAVAKGLAWLAKHQMPDGGWSFDLEICPTCKGKCKGSGKLAPARNAATALGVLPFLAAGHTHKVGKYKQNVNAALLYLASHTKSTPNGGDLTEGGGSMYSHGLASIALCEGYAMSHDKTLAPVAQAALNYIMAAQDPEGGGWRYSFRAPGDTSVVGWQLMALKSGIMGSLSVNPRTIQGATQFLNAMQTEDGAKYGYDKPGATPSMTAVGLLCRMYLGWKQEDPNLAKGVEFLSKLGPSKTDIYYNYYATQVMMQYEGPLWVRWNDKMRDQLVYTQATSGHEEGSWIYEGGHNDAGGRLYCTALSVLTLEVYYRHLPLYRQ
jgi:hypothetical protein